MKRIRRINTDFNKLFFIFIRANPSNPCLSVFYSSNRDYTLSMIPR